MGRLKYFGFVASLFMVAPGLARAKDANLMADVRCVIIGVRMMGDGQNASLKTAGLMLDLYYLGRLDGRDPHFDLEDAIVAQLPKMSQSDYAANARRCGRSLQLKGAQITMIGKELIRRGHAMQKK